MNEPIRDVIALDKVLAAEAERASAQIGATFNSGVQTAAAARHGMATDLRALIAGWVAETREDDERDAAIERLEEAHRV